ncbi:unnamed protein product (macronuclear) [Paramecium tetraurelia]|uniref:Armadillo-type fold n=1 Tax=Paramecium tetraurelia TaxID=5888 RepID=A0C104_PARTE|nr:uncharacterized protein GSPATT00033947001 [Paramecium tetraurelia]CAK64471.1 unnamed protein product [Paramecium tetraurelia]|eukprot:XP_001431869.1 hypothetical protein (macronuclear) [Paramecium tetraurelia strain d4-2]
MYLVHQSSFHWFFQRSPTFDLHFNNEDLQLTTLLDDDNLITEAQSQNEKILDLQYNQQINSVQEDQVLELIKYITEMPEDDSNSKRAYRYPYYSSALLCFIVKGKPQYFIENDKRLLYKLLNFFSQDQDVNSVLAGFVINVLQNIQEELLVGECFQNPQIQEGMIRQLQSRSVSDFLLYLLQVQSQQYQNEKVNLLQSILKRIDDSTNFEISSNVSYIIQELIKVEDYQQWYMDIIFGEFINKLCQTILFKDNFISLSSSTILFNLLQFLKNTYQKQYGSKVKGPEIDVNMVFSRIEPYCTDWIEYLLNQKSTILGQQKLKLLEIIGVGVSLNNQQFINRLYQCNIFKVYNQLFLTYEQHDILHFQYFNLISQTIENQIDILIKNLFEENQFIQLLIQCTNKVDNQEKQRKGQLGFITLLGIFIVEKAENYEYLQQYLQNESWQQFKTQYIEKAQKINNFELGQDGIDQLYKWKEFQLEGDTKIELIEQNKEQSGNSNQETI